MELRQVNNNLPRMVTSKIGPSRPSIQANSTAKKIQNYLFNLNQVLGQGNFSKVYKAVNITNNQIVAIKVIEMLKMKAPTLNSLLESEIDILGKMSHQNILTCFEVFTSVNNCYIITEVCESDLETSLMKTGPLDEQRARKTIFEIFEGLRYLADEGIVHRDLKIANIFVKGGVAKIADFGFAKKSRQNWRDVSIGTPIYMAPEGLLEHIYGPKTDVWAFGVVMYEILHGNPPLYFCLTETELKQNVSKPINQNWFGPNISQDLRTLVMRCLEVDWRKRPTIHELLGLPYVQGLMQQFSKSQEIIINNNLLPLQSPLIQIGSLASYPQSPRTSNSRSSFSIPAQTLQLQKASSMKRASIDQYVGVVANINRDKNYENSSQTLQMTQPTLKSKSSQMFKEFIVTRITFQEALQVLHYCRLVFKTWQLIQQQSLMTNTLIAECYGSAVLELITQIKGKLKKCVLLTKETPLALEQRLRGVIDEYYTKYHAQITRSQKIGYDVLTVQTCSLKALRQLDAVPASSMNPRDQLIISIYIKYVYDVSKVLEGCIEGVGYSRILKEVNIEQFLKIKYDSFDETYYLPIKAKIQELQL